MDMKEKIYKFRVSLKRGWSPMIYREMMLKGSSSLYEFAETITGAYNFNMDHAFTYFGDYPDEEDEDDFLSHRIEYTLFYDVGCVVEPYERSVERTYIHEVFVPGKVMPFKYDYGADWDFMIKCLGVFEAEVGETYPKVTKIVGEAPAQYYYGSDEDVPSE